MVKYDFKVSFALGAISPSLREWKLGGDGKDFIYFVDIFQKV